MRRQASPLPPNYSSVISRSSVAPAELGLGLYPKTVPAPAPAPAGYLWVKIENSGDAINQAFRVQIHDNDTVEDLKDVILQKLNTSRWAKVNDNASISLGVYTNGGNVMGAGPPSLASMPAQYHTNYTTGANAAAGSDVLNSPIDIVPKLFQKQQQQMTPQSAVPDSAILTPQPKQNTHPSKLSVVTATNEQPPLRSLSPKSFMNMGTDGSLLDHSPSRIYTTSPKLASLPKALMSRTNSITMSPTAANGMHAFLNATGRPYSQSRMASNEGNLTSASTSPTAAFPHSISKLKYRTEVINKTGASFRLTFMPDELAVNILHCMFNDNQPASEPLLIFSSTELSIEHHDTVELAMTTPEGDANGTPTQRPVVKLDPIDVSAHGRHRKIGPIEIGGDGQDDDSAPEDSEPDISTPAEYKTYKLITNEKQLQEASNFMNGEEGLVGDEPSPKQAILLLPKGYAEEYNTSNSASLDDELDQSLKTQHDIQQAIATQLSSTSPSTSLSSATLQHNFDLSLQDDDSQYLANHQQQQQQPHQRQASLSESNHHHVPLNEQEVGIIDPMVGSQWQDKSSPTKSGTPIDTPTSIDSADLVRGRGNASDSSLSKTHSKPLPKDRPLPHPVRPRPKPSSSSAPKSTSERVFPKINVLIVEDNVINQAILGSFLRKHKISYKVAKKGKEAVDIWKEGGLHLIFMDLQLPVLSGIEAAKQIRNYEKDRNKEITSGRKSPPVIIVALTASNSIEDKRNALLSGCNDYLTKPVNLHWLSKKITEWGCMQALIDFDSWKQGQSRMTDSLTTKSAHPLKGKAIS